MAIGIFTDKKQPPDEASIQQAIGPAVFPLWQALIEFVHEEFEPAEELKFMYGKKYGWAQHFELNRKMLINLYPAEGRFVAQINLPETAAQEALRWELAANARQAIERAFPYPEGRWIFTPVESAADLADVRRLLALRVASRF